MSAVIKNAKSGEKIKMLLFIAAFLSVLGLIGINAKMGEESKVGPAWLGIESNRLVEKDKRRIITQNLSSSFVRNEFASNLDITFLGSKEKVKVLYTFDIDLQKELEKLMKQYASDYASVVAMDPITGKVLAMASYENGIPSKENWALKATFPAASIFKIITASAALEKYNISPEMEMGFTGGSYKLYKRDLFNENERWAHWISFKEAFAKSINIFFGKLVLKFMHADDLMSYAKKFYFNKDLKGDLPAESGKAFLDSKEPYHVAEVASGFNSLNTLSPIHGAMIASAVVNDGVMQSPYIVDSLLRDNGSSVYKSEPLTLESPISISTARKLRDLMSETVERGTSRKSFRELASTKQYSIVETGGKTGSLNGHNPKGKTDWFVGYARLGTRMLAVSVVTVNKNYWKVKSSYIAQRLIKKHFKDDVNFSTAKLDSINRGKVINYVDN